MAVRHADSGARSLSGLQESRAFQGRCRDVSEANIKVILNYIFGHDRRAQLVPRELRGTCLQESIRIGARPITRFSERSASAFSTFARGYVPDTTGFTRPDPTQAAASANSARFT